MATLSAPPQSVPATTTSANGRVFQNRRGKYIFVDGKVIFIPSDGQVRDVKHRLSLKEKIIQARAQRNSKYDPIPRGSRAARRPSNFQPHDEISEVTSLLSKADICGSSYLKESAPQSREASEDEGDMDEDDAVDDSGESADDEDDAEEAGEADEEAEEQSGDEDAMDGSGDEDEDDEDERVPQCADVDVEDESDDEEEEEEEEEEEGEDCTKDQEAAATNVEGTDDREDEDDGAANSPNYELASAEAEHDSSRQCRDRSPTPHPSRSVDDARDEHPSWQLGDGELPDFEEVEKEAEAKEREQEACVKLVEQLIEEVASNPSSSPTQHAVQPPHEAEDTLPVPDESQNEDPTLDHPSLAATPATPGPHDERSPSPEVTSEQFAEWVGPSSSDEENEEDQPIQPENVAATVDEQQELPAPAPSPSSSSRAPAESTTGSEVTEISPCTFPPLDTAPSSHEPDTMIVEPAAAAAAAATATPIHNFELSTSTFSTSLPSSFSSWLSPSLPASLAYPLPCPFPSSSPLPSSLPSSPPSSSLFPSSFSPSSSSFTTPPPVVSAFPTLVPDVATHSIHVVGSLPSAPALSATPATVFPDEQMEVDDTSVPMEITPPPLPEHQLSRYSNQSSFKLKAGGRQAQRNPRLRLSVLKQNQSRNRKAASTRTAGDGRLPLRLRRHNSPHWLDRTFVILMAIVVSRQRRLRKTISDRALRAQVARLAHQTRQSFAGRRTCAQQEPTMVVDCLLLVDEDIDMDNAVVDHDIAIPETTQSTAQAVPFVAPAVPLLPSVSHTTREMKLWTAYSNAPAATVPTATAPAATVPTATAPAATTSAPTTSAPASPVPTSPVHISSAPTATVATAPATNAPATTESLATETSLHSSATTSLDLQPQADESTIGPIAPTAVADESVGITAVGVSDIALVVPPPIVATQGPSIEFVIEGDISGSDEDDEETDYSSSSTSYSSSSSSASSYSSTSPFSYARAPLSTPPTSNLTPVAASVRGSEHTEYATAVSFSAKKPPVQRVDGRVSGTGEHTHPIVTKAVTSRYSSLANALGNYPSAPAPPAPLSVPSAQPVKTGVWTPAASLPSASSSALPTRPHQVSLAERCAFMSGSGPGGMTPSQKKVARLKQLQEEKRKRQAIIAVAEASYDLKNAPDPAPASSPPTTTSAPLLENPCPNTNAEERAVRGGCISPAVNAEAPLVLGSSNSTQGDIPVTVPETDDESVPSIARPDTGDVHYDQPGEQTGFEDMHTQVDQRPPSGITDEPQLSSSASSKGKAKMSDEEAEAYYRAQRVESSYMARAMSPIPQEFPAHTHSTVEQSVREHPLAQLHGLSDDEIEWNAMVFGPNQWSDGVSDPSVSQHVPDLQGDEEYSTTGDGNAPEQVRSESLGAQNGSAAFEEHTLSLATCIPAIHVVPPSPYMSAQDMSKSASLWSSASSGSTVLPTSPEPAGAPLKQPKNRRVSQSTAKRMKQRMVSRSAVPTSMSEPRPSLLDSFAFQSIGTQDPITGHLDSTALAHPQASEGSFSSDMFGAAMDGLPNSTFNAVFASMEEFLRPFDNDGSGQSAQATSPPSPPEVVGTINSLFEAEASQYSERVNDGAIPSATDPLSQLADVAALMSYASSLSNVPDSSADGFQTGSLWAEGMLVDPEVVTGGSPAPIESIGDVPMSDGSVQAQHIPPPFEGFEVYAEDPLSPSLIFAQTFDEPIFDEQLTQQVPEVEPIAVAEMSVPVTSEAHPIPLPLAEVTTTEPQRVGPEALSEAEGEAEPVLSPVVSEESSAEDLPSEPPGDHPEQASQSQPAVIEDDHAQPAPTQDGVATATISPYTPLVKRERPEGLVHRLHGTSAVPRSFFSAGGPYRYMSLDMPVRCRARQKTRSARGQVPRFLRSLPSPQLSRASSPDASIPGAAEAAEDVPSPPSETVPLEEHEEEPRSPSPPPSAPPPRPPSPTPVTPPPPHPSDRPSHPLPRRFARPPAHPSPTSRPAPRPAPRRRAPAPAPSHEPETYWHRRMRTGFTPKASRAEAKASAPPSSPSSSSSSSRSASPSRPSSRASDRTAGSDLPSRPASPVSSDPSSTDSASSDEGEGEDVDDPFPGSFPCGPGSERESASERENAVKFALALIACVAFQIVYSAAA